MLGNFQRIVYLNAEVTYCRFQLGVPE